jgi:hypothetical protein
MTYYEFQEHVVVCKECGWSGKGSQTTPGEIFDYGYEFHCPQCDNRFSGLVPFPTIKETLADSQSDPVDRMVAEIVHSRTERYGRLSSANQLPDLDPIPQTLTWDVVEADGESWIVILNGEQEIWRELSYWENYKRFGEVAKILAQKYGKALRDLVLADHAFVDLYGDKVSAVGYADRVREALARGQVESI